MQISLPPQEHRRVKARAAELGISAAEYVRRLVARDSGASPTPFNPTGLIGLGSSGGSDIARFKDEYIGDAVEQLS